VALRWAAQLSKESFFFPLALQPTFGPWPTSMKLCVSLQFTRSWTFGRTPWTGDQLVARPLHKHRTNQTQNKRTHRHPCVKWDSNPRSQRSSERREFML
jgi:hypothetical protein